MFPIRAILLAAVTEVNGSCVQRIFSYSERLDWILIGISFLAAAASGTALAMMELVFGEFIGLVHAFTMGTISPAQFRYDVGAFASVTSFLILKPNF